MMFPIFLDSESLKNEQKHFTGTGFAMKVPLGRALTSILGAENEDNPPVFCVFKGGHIDVSKNSGAPEWMVYNGNPY